MPKYPTVQRFFASQFEAATGQTQKDLADHVGVEEGSVSRWVAGDSRPKRTYWEGIASFFGVNREAVMAAVLGRPPELGDDAVAVLMTAITSSTKAATDLMERIDERLESIDRRLATIETARRAARSRPSAGQ